MKPVTSERNEICKVIALVKYFEKGNGLIS